MRSNATAGSRIPDPIRAASAPPTATSAGTRTEPGHLQRLEQGERPRQHVGLGHALEQRASRDVEDDPSHPHRGEEHERSEHGRERPEQHERRPHERRAGQERKREPLPADERHGDDGAEHCAGAQGGVQVAGAGLAEVEYVDREHDREHVERPDHHRLRSQEQHEQPRR